MKCVLYIALADNAEMIDCLNSNLAERMIFGIGKRLRRRDNDALAGMDAHRVHVLHIAHGDRITVTIAHDFIFNFLPAGEILFDEHLGF